MGADFSLLERELTSKQGGYHDPHANELELEMSVKSYVKPDVDTDSYM